MDRKTERQGGWSVRRVIRRSSKILAVIAAIGILIMMIATVADVITRYRTGRSIAGVLEYIEVLMVGTVYLGLAYAQSKDAHVGVSLVTSRMPTRVANIVKAVGLMVVAAALAWMAWETLEVARASVAAGEYRFGLAQVPIWPARITIPVGLLFLLMEMGIDIVDLLRGRVEGSGTASMADSIAGDKPEAAGL